MWTHGLVTLNAGSVFVYQLHIEHGLPPMTRASPRCSTSGIGITYQLITSPTQQLTAHQIETGWTARFPHCIRYSLITSNLSCKSVDIHRVVSLALHHRWFRTYTHSSPLGKVNNSGLWPIKLNWCARWTRISWMANCSWVAKVRTRLNTLISRISSWVKLNGFTSFLTQLISSQIIAKPRIYTPLHRLFTCTLMVN